jgi:hypothetical protein
MSSSTIIPLLADLKALVVSLEVLMEIILEGSPALEVLAVLVVDQEVSQVLEVRADQAEVIQVEVKEGLVVSEATQVLEVREDQAEVIQVQVRENPVVPGATQVLEVRADQAEVIQVQVREGRVVLEVQADQVEGIQVQVRKDPVVPADSQVLEHPEVLVLPEVDLEVFQVDPAEDIQVQAREDPVPPEDFQVLEVLTKVTQAQEVQVDLAKVSQVQGGLEVRLVNCRVQGHHLVECQRTHSSHLVEALDLLSQTENICRLTTDNDLMPTNGRAPSHFI